MEFLVHLTKLPYFYFKKKIGVDFALKRLDYNDNTSIQLQLWGI
jgi:hypothetical protein